MNAPDFSKNLIGAYFLRWVMDGAVRVLPDPHKEGRVNLSFEKTASFSEAIENDLYQMVREASGENLILEAGELEKWSKKSFRRVSDFPGRAKTCGRKWFQDQHYIIKNDKCNAEGQEQARHLIEFKNYLEDFTLHKEHGAIEVTLWKDYLVFSALFGIAEKVATEFQKLYPAQFTEFTQSSGMSSTTFHDMMLMSNTLSASAIRAAKNELSSHTSHSSSGRSYGGGGRSSFGGGGHSFGGSHGGGSR